MSERDKSDSTSSRPVNRAGTASGAATAAGASSVGNYRFGKTLGLGSFGKGKLSLKLITKESYMIA